MSIVKDTLFSKLSAAIASAALIGGGTVVLSGAQTNAVQNTELSELHTHDARTDDAIDRLNATVQQLDKNVAVLNERLK